MNEIRLRIKNTRSHVSIVYLLAAVIGSILIGCESINSSSKQQSTQSANTMTKEAPVDRVASSQKHQPKSKPKIDTARGNIPATSNQSASTGEVVGIQQGMPYKEARKILLRQGWQANLPVSNGQLPNLENAAIKAAFELGFEEIKDCSGTGLGLCRFEFINYKGEQLVVSATRARSDKGKLTVWRWFLEENSDPTPTEPASTKIPDGRYWLGATDQGLEVSGDRYRYDTEGGEQAWQEVSKLKYVNNGVIYDGKNYWCLSTLAPNPVTGCSAAGWSR
ncbi:hypothetical protein [Chamaesiphon sp. VAR_48_metabat_135_sub]|uniref:hypothetical protein n=1 Tax=Chamaesiphon sp. VAR_48_metabat_135_sub TaxID=2964699 RepID=UPI00286A235C|nr:hypothetical protein [Chamaesiphon sp. VAR_48_metabat_135_sub]